MSLVDQTARETVHTDLGATLFVEAGAGTGKTHSLVERIVALVSTGTLAGGIRDVAAITFTENAAAELRNRVRQRLTEVAEDAHSEAGRRCSTALAALDDASLSTLHGFAGRLLADHPMAVGLPVGFSVQDDIRAGIERDLWWEGVVDVALEDPVRQHVWRTSMALGLGPSSLRMIADRLHAEWDLLEPELPAAQLIPVWDLDAVLSPLRRAADYAAAGPAADTLMTYLRTTLVPLLAELDAEPDDLGRASILVVTGIKTSGGDKAKLAKAGLSKADVIDSLVQAKQAWEAQLAAVRTACLEQLVSWLREVVLQDADRRRKAGHLHFHDLLVLARRLLLDDEPVRLQLHQRWPVLLVDEFQDTDPLQVEVVHLLAASSRPDRWQDVQDDSGRLFFVGDPKQSIYRFRRADVGLYQDVRDTIALRPALTQNFRSRPVVLDVVNSALGAMMHEQPDQVPYVDLHAARLGPDDADPGPAVILLGGPQPGKMDDVRRAEASHLAATCRRVVTDGWLVRDGKAEASRPAAYRDIALLVPTRTSLSNLERELQAADVPYRIESRSLVWDTDVVRELLGILEAVADPGDAVAVATALRSAAFGCTDVDLVAWRRNGGRWDYRSTDGTGPVAEAMTQLRGYHDLRWWLPVNQLVERLIRERHMVELTTGLARPRDHWRRLRFVTDQARAYLDGGGSSLVGFVRWAREQADRGADSVETVIDEPDDDAVRILTIHSSKGLQFPVTVVSGVNVDDRLEVKVLWHEPTGLQVKVKGFKTTGWDAAVAVERTLQEAESVRLLYVAVTRAEDHLVISLHHKARERGQPKNHAGRLYSQLEVLQAAGADHELTHAEPTPTTIVRAVPPVADLAGRTAFMDERTALLERVRRSLPVSASTLSGEQDGPVDELIRTVESAEHADEPTVLRPPAAGGATLGSAVHRVLELIEFDCTEAELLAVARAVTEELDAPGLLGETVRRVRVALGSELLQTAGAQLWKEVPVSAPVGERFVEGYIDLVLRTPTGLVVVDYKTDSARTNAEIDAKAAHYAPQLRAYATALAKATGMSVTGAVLLFLGSDTATARDVALHFRADA